MPAEGRKGQGQGQGCSSLCHARLSRRAPPFLFCKPQPRTTSSLSLFMLDGLPIVQVGGPPIQVGSFGPQSS
ncbi:hypothetical protein Zm00014a_004568 [Zea mays]|uniref:Uncharacterized protein n=1 Tax=Zea mays TaxID=4577 RepID=A0A3L6E1A5_MAIZE|nr:hypothetical protein Zm00014a_004568 [Zea mays]